VQVIDVHTVSAYRQSHVDGAVRIPYAKTSSNPRCAFDFCVLDEKVPVICYAGNTKVFALSLQLKNWVTDAVNGKGAICGLASSKHFVLFST